MPLNRLLAGIPDFRDDIANWNTAWEARFSLLHSTIGNLDILVASCPPPPSAQEALLHSYNTMRKICRVQEQIRVLAVTTVFQPDFCWKGLAPAEGEAHMLEGLLRACMMDPNGPKSRMYTCDITLASLEVDNGEGFLILLKRYVSDGEGSVTNSRCASHLHPGWTRAAVERLKNAGHAISLQARMTTMSAFVYNTISSVIGAHRPEDSRTLDWGTFPRTPARKKKKYTIETPNVRSKYRLALCKKCNERMSRKIYYCSKTCQMLDWPTHKRICGKELTCAIIENLTLHTESSVVDAVFLLRRMGPTREGYTRSPALVRQMLFIDSNPGRDYVFFSPTGPQPIGMPEFLSRLFFRLAMQTAMATGDPECIAALIEVIIPRLSAEQSFVVDQLVQEYGEADAHSGQLLSTIDLIVNAVYLVLAVDKLPLSGDTTTGPRRLPTPRK
ncbi:hypothetical protein B0H16DRAFT_1841998 [Mycena metata]|uniref:MYND-type domain-containing protein n=1 Tax=Mycena metata TaxID=1033252 RepID=A0AAD7N836_9AGAR|nr:hypothetical protein B0H16DRAFT_1841998 [Mycena metata]